MRVIRVQGLTKRYGHRRGVEDIAFEVKEGEVVGFLGPNGAGKTTTLRCLTGYHPPTEGKITVAGFDVFEDALEVKRRIGYLPETPPLYREMTVRDYLMFVARVKGVPKSQRLPQIEEAVERTGLQPVYRRLIANISKGYRQRTGLAQALVGKPPVLILDEPTVGLDPRQIIEVRELIRSLGEEHTVILSSHILPEVSQVCERVIIINEGRLVATDTPEALSKRLAGSNRLLLRVDGRAEQVEEVLGEVEGVAAVSDLRPEGGMVRAEIEVAQGAEIRRDLFFRLAEAQMPIMELRPVDLSLEEVFLRLTTEEPAEAKAGSASEVAQGA